jgi:ABC-type polysaccharide/polyol phosphate export permease
VNEALRENWAFRGLARALVRRNLKVRYQRSVIGFAWTLLNPTITIAILVLVFQHFLRIDVPDYWAFLVSGYFAWVFTTHTLGSAPAVLPNHSYMTRSLAFPSELLVVSAALARLAEFMAELLLAVVVLAIFHHQALPASFVLLPLVTALHALLLVGLALPLAALSVFFDDVSHAVPAVLLLVGFLSPVYYPLQFVPEALRAWFLLNPLAPLFEVYRAILYEGRWPSLGALALVAAMGTISALLGLLLYRWKRPYFAEIL